MQRLIGTFKVKYYNLDLNFIFLLSIVPTIRS